MCDTCHGITGEWWSFCPSCRSRFALRPLDHDVELDDVVSPLDAQGEQRTRIRTRVSVLDTITDGGLPEDSATVLYGSKGSGKTRLCVQLAAGTSAMYLCGEQPAADVNAIAAELKVKPRSSQLVDTDDVDVAARAIRRDRPRVVIADSWQTMWTERVDGMPGSHKQNVEVLATLRAAAAGDGFALVLVSQCNSKGTPAVREKLLHDVDAILSLRKIGDNKRTLRVMKSRYCKQTTLAVTLTSQGFRATRSSHLELVQD